MRTVDVNTAVGNARVTARNYAGATLGLRVEEVEQIDESSWNITLSWLEEDTAQKVRDNADPFKRMRVVPAPTPLERVFRTFEIRGDKPARMRRAPEP